MKTKNIIILLLLFLSVCLHAQSWMWGRQGKAPGGVNGCGHPFTSSSSTSGANNNAYVTGQYEDSLIFGAFSLHTGSIYVAKYNAIGTLIWALSSTDSLVSSGFGGSVAPDRNGNVYVTGGFAGNVKLGTFNLKTSNGSIVAPFLIKLDSNGNVLWARQGTILPTIPLGGGKGIGLAIDEEGNPIISGAFSGTILFSSDTLINPNSNSDFFTAKYDPNGNLVWARQSTNQSNNLQVYMGTITADNSENIIISGGFAKGSITFGSFVLTNNTNLWSELLVKYSSAGNVLWAKQSINPVGYSSKDEAMAAAVITDRANNIYVVGDFEDTVQFGNYNLYSTQNYNMFLAKYDTNGNVFWVKQSSPGWMANSLAADAHNRLYLGGFQTWNDTILRFGNYSLVVKNGSYIMTLDTSGNAICSSVLDIGPPSISSDSTGKYIYMAGTFAKSTIVCGPDTLTDNSGPNGNSIFVGRWLDCYNEEGINDIAKDKIGCVLYPNPNTGNFQIAISQQLSANSQIEVYNILGEQVYQAPLNATTTQISMSNKAEGLYLYRVITKTGTLVGEGKFVIQR